jgi:hypothetical protein
MLCLPDWIAAFGSALAGCWEVQALPSGCRCPARRAYRCLLVQRLKQWQALLDQAKAAAPPQHG